jgi:hypothetical protein
MHLTPNCGRLCCAPAQGAKGRKGEGAKGHGAKGRRSDAEPSWPLQLPGAERCSRFEARDCGWPKAAKKPLIFRWLGDRFPCQATGAGPCGYIWPGCQPPGRLRSAPRGYARLGVQGRFETPPVRASGARSSACWMAQMGSLRTLSKRGPGIRDLDRRAEPRLSLCPARCRRKPQSRGDQTKGLFANEPSPRPLLFLGLGRVSTLIRSRISRPDLDTTPHPLPFIVARAVSP